MCFSKTTWGRDQKGEKLLIGYLRFHSNVNIKRNKFFFEKQKNK